MNTTPLEGKVIILIGGTSGLGRSAARALVGAGARLIAVGLDAVSVDHAATELGDSARVLIGDASQPSTADQAIRLAVETFGRLDGLYHVAGGSGRRRGDGPLHDLTDAGWDYTLRLNLTSQFYSNRAAVRQFLDQGDGGVILNMGSVLAWSPSPEHFSTAAYAAAKSAVIGMTRAAASYYTPHRIRFNVIAPALVQTPMSQRAATDETILNFIANKQPLDGGRIGRPEDLDAAVVYLLSDEAKLITGQVLAVDGGWCVSEGTVATA